MTIDFSPRKTEAPSEGDIRSTNNAVRHQSRVLSEAEKAHIHQIIDMGAGMIAYCECLGQSRELSIAKKKIEEAVIWAAKHITV